MEPKSTHIVFYKPVSLTRGSVLLGTILRNAGYDIEVYAEGMGGIDYGRLAQADFVGISLLTATAPKSYQIAAFCTQRGIPVVLGGIHMRFCPHEGLRHAPYVIRGEGETALPALVECLNNGGSLRKIPGLSFVEEGSIVENLEGTRLAQAELDRNPVPDYALIGGIRRVPWVSLQTQRGCPFTCKFCTVWTSDGNELRCYSNEWIWAAEEYYRKQFGTNTIFFADDIFNLPREKKKELLRGMIERDMRISWGAQVRQEVAYDEEFLNLAAESGCNRLLIGFESPNPATLDYYRKKAPRQDIAEVCRRIRDHGIHVPGLFMLGAPTDTVKTADEILAVAREHMDTMQVTVLTIGPGAETYEDFQKAGGVLLEEWDRFDGHHACHHLKSMSRYQAVYSAWNTMRRFYSFSGLISRGIRRNGPTEMAMSCIIKWNVWQWFREHKEYLEMLRREQESEGVLSPP